MIAFDSKGCTLALDEAITAARLRYASERDDFHDHFPCQTTLQLRHVLRGQQGSDLRREIVRDLFVAQQTSTHELWALLLIQACELHLIARRRAIVTGEDPRVDQLVMDTFLEAISSIPGDLEPDEIEAYVRRTSSIALKKALRGGRVGMVRAVRAAQRARRSFRQAQQHLVDASY